uniref:Dynein axonemal assembly factor 1 homolog n=1 Tax=Glossina brevipalpis TaxID=37001 RepID=A0A1A9WER6_9MUSC
MMVYDWMLTEEPLVQREGMLELFIAAIVLRIKEFINQCWLCFDDYGRYDTAFIIYPEHVTITQEVCILLSSNTIGVNSEIEGIECLEEYTELKCLWLECNAISEIQGLENQSKLKCLFLQSNLIQRIENLDFCKELDTLNLSQNHIRKIENCGTNSLPVLNTLNLSSNYIRDSEGLKELENCQNLSVLDLSNNRIDDILVVKIFSKMPELKVLVLHGNPVVSKIPQYRKTLILECKKLTYLDTRPVFPKDRACAEAWKRGGYEEEHKENMRWNRKERKKITDSVNATIRMRNKYRNAEDQLELIPSSDSEDDAINEAKRRQQAELDLGVSMELGLWDEVAEKFLSESQSSSDMNVSSSTSAISTTDSNGGQDSSDARTHESLEILNNTNCEKKILNDAAEKNTKVLQVNESEFISEGEEDRVSADKKAEKIEELSDNLKVEVSNSSLDTDDECKNQFNETVDAINRVTTTINDLSQNDKVDDNSIKWIRLQIDNGERNKESEGEDDKNYEPLKAIDDLMDTLSKPISHEILEENSITLTVKTAAEMEYEKECAAVNEEVQKNFEELSTDMDLYMIEMHKDRDERELTKDALFNRVLEKVEKESSSSGSSIHEVEEESEDVRIERMVDEWDKETRVIMSKRVSRETKLKPIPEIWLNDKPMTDDLIKHEETTEQTGSLSGEQPLPILESKPNLKQNPARTIIEYEGIYESLKALKEERESSIDAAQELAAIKKLRATKDQLKISKIVDCHLVKQSKEEKGEELLQVDEIQSTKVRPNHDPTELSVQKRIISNKSEISLPPRLEYEPLDVSRLMSRSREALKAFEEETRGLKILLQQLEDENEKRFENGSDVEKCIEEKTTKQNDDAEINVDVISKTKDKISEQEEVNEKTDEVHQELSINEEQTTDLCLKVVDDVVYSLDLKPFKPKSYEFGLIESDDEYSYSGPKKAEEEIPPSKTIRGVINSFNDFLHEITTRNREEMRQEHIERKKRAQVASTDEEKSASLRELLQQPNIKDFNKDTHASLDAKLEVYEKKKNVRVKRLVERVYAQKDKYNDSLEVVEGKLMVLKKDTGELEDLPKPLGEVGEDDSDDEYESDYGTAQSHDGNQEGASELYNTCESEMKAQDSICSNSQLWYKPRERKPAETLVMQALNCNFRNKESDEGDKENEDDDDDDNDNEEYQSLDGQHKPFLFGHIDAEFFNKLDFESLQFNARDEQCIVQCARSYDELRKFLKLEEDERHLSEEENGLLEKMIARQAEKPGCSDDVLPLDDSLTREEDLLLKKMLERTKELLEKEDYDKNARGDCKEYFDVDIQKVSHFDTQESVKLYEYKFENTLQERASAIFEKKFRNIGDTAEPEFSGNGVYTFVYQDKEDCDEKQNLSVGNKEKKSSTELPVLSVEVALEKSSEEEKNELENNFDTEAKYVIKKSDESIEDKEKDSKNKDHSGEFRQLIDDVEESEEIENNMNDRVNEMKFKKLETDIQNQKSRIQKLQKKIGCVNKSTQCQAAQVHEERNPIDNQVEEKKMLDSYNETTQYEKIHLVDNMEKEIEDLKNFEFTAEESKQQILCERDSTEEITRESQQISNSFDEIEAENICGTPFSSVVAEKSAINSEVIIEDSKDVPEHFAIENNCPLTMSSERSFIAIEKTETALEFSGPGWTQMKVKEDGNEVLIGENIAGSNVANVNHPACREIFTRNEANIYTYLKFSGTQGLSDASGTINLGNVTHVKEEQKEEKIELKEIDEGEEKEHDDLEETISKSSLVSKTLECNLEILDASNGEELDDLEETLCNSSLPPQTLECNLEETLCNSSLSPKKLECNLEETLCNSSLPPKILECNFEILDTGNGEGLEEILSNSSLPSKTLECNLEMLDIDNGEEFENLEKTPCNSSLPPQTLQCNLATLDTDNGEEFDHLEETPCNSSLPPKTLECDLETLDTDNGEEFDHLEETPCNSSLPPKTLECDLETLDTDNGEEFDHLEETPCNSSLPPNILECNLEILDVGNGEVIDSVTVNAEIGQL